MASASANISVCIVVLILDKSGLVVLTTIKTFIIQHCTCFNNNNSSKGTCTHMYNIV